MIPKKIHDQLGLAPGDYLDVEARQGKLILTPKTLVKKHIRSRLAEGLEDIRRGRVLRAIPVSEGARPLSPWPRGYLLDLIPHPK